MVYVAGFNLNTLAYVAPQCEQKKILNKTFIITAVSMKH